MAAAASVSGLWLKKIISVLYGRGSATRAELVESAGLNVASVSITLRRLMANGVVQTLGKLNSTGGRKSEALRLNPEAAYFLVLDLEGARNRFGLVNFAGDIRYRWDEPCENTPVRVAAIADGMRAVLDGLQPAEKKRTIAASVCYSGLLDPSGGLTAVNLGWRGVHLAEELQKALELPVFLGADCFIKALVEHSLGAARGVKNCMYISVDAGIGAGFYVDGHLLRGRDRMAGEFGHLTLVPDAPDLCKCGKTGCLEAISSGPAIVRQYAEAAGQDAGPLTVFSVFERARAGDRTAQRILDRAARYLGLGLSHLVNLLNPEMIVLGGEVLAGKDLLLEPIERQLRQHALPSLTEGLTITTSSLGQDIGLKGAASLAFRRAIEQPELLKRICSPVLSPRAELTGSKR